MVEMSLLEKKLAAEPIYIPENPFWDVFKRFGRDEAISMIVNLFGTGLISYAVDNKLLEAFAGPLSRRARDITKSISGPIVEKAGFFPAHFMEAYREWRESPLNERDTLSTYFKSAVRGGTKSLVEDIAVHDPLYIGLMFSGLQLYPNTPAWILSVVSFVTAVFGVAALEVGVTEAAYFNYKRALKKAGFGTQSYLESRFFISSDKNPYSLIESLVREFGLNEPKIWHYHDRYYPNNLPHYSKRVPKIRLRHRYSDEGQLNSAQVIFTRAAEYGKGEQDQYRYFPIRKDKLYFPLNFSCPLSPEGIEDNRARRIFSRALKNNCCNDINFERTLAHSPDLFVSTDHVKHKRPFYVAELKVYEDKKLLKQAMRYVMLEFPVMETTHGKSDLMVLNG